MLQSIRDRAQGWIAWFIVALISVPFALWGIQEYIGGGTEPLVATVNGQKITEREFERRYRDYRQSLRQRLGDAYRADLFDEAMLRKESLESMIRNELIIQQADTLGMKAGADMIRSAISEIPAFQVNGRFNINAYERVLNAQGLTPQGFEDRMHRALLTEQLQGAISRTNWVTQSELEEAIRLRRQRRTFDYLLFPAAPYKESVEVSDPEVESYYNENSARFASPERIQVEYIELNQETIAATLTADNETLMGYYEQHRDNYVTPEQRKASHILFVLEEGADEEQTSAVMSRVEATLERLRAGEAFADLAQELSEDPGSADNGGDLGYFGRNVMDPAFENATFALNEGEISEPVRSLFGLHIIQLTGIQPESGKSFEEAREEVTDAYLNTEAERLFFDYAERLANHAYEEPDTLLPAAEAVGVEIRKSDWIPRPGGEGIFGNPKLITAAFSDDVLHQGNNSELIELTPQHNLVLRVTDHQESAIRPLPEVRDQIVATLTQEKAAAEAKRVAQGYLEQLKAKELKLEEVAEAISEAVEYKIDIQRTHTDGPREIINAAFRLPAPAEEGALSHGEIALTNGDYAILLLSEVKDGDVTLVTEEEKRRIQEGIAGSLGRAEFQHMVKNLREQGEITTTLPKPDR